MECARWRNRWPKNCPDLQATPIVADQCFELREGSLGVEAFEEEIAECARHAYDYEVRVTVDGRVWEIMSFRKWEALPP